MAEKICLILKWLFALSYFVLLIIVKWEIVPSSVNSEKFQTIVRNGKSSEFMLYAIRTNRTNKLADIKDNWKCKRMGRMSVSDSD